MNMGSIEIKIDKNITYGEDYLYVNGRIVNIKYVSNKNITQVI